MLTRKMPGLALYISQREGTSDSNREVEKVADLAEENEGEGRVVETRKLCVRCLHYRKI